MQDLQLRSDAQVVRGHVFQEPAASSAEYSIKYSAMINTVNTQSFSS